MRTSTTKLAIFSTALASATATALLMSACSQEKFEAKTFGVHNAHYSEAAPYIVDQLRANAYNHEQFERLSLIITFEIAGLSPDARTLNIQRDGSAKVTATSSAISFEDDRATRFNFNSLELDILRTMLTDIHTHIGRSPAIGSAPQFNQWGLYNIIGGGLDPLGRPLQREPLGGVSIVLSSPIITDDLPEDTTLRLTLPNEQLTVTAFTRTATPPLAPRERMPVDRLAVQAPLDQSARSLIILLLEKLESLEGAQPISSTNALPWNHP